MLIFRLLPRSVIFATILFFGSIAQGQEPPDSHELEGITVDHGIGLYLEGRLREAKIALQAASATAENNAIENEALIYLAEIEYYLGERDAAWLTCQRIVANDENYRPDPLVHPPEMLVFFETARIATVESSTTTDSLPDSPASDTGLNLMSFLPGAPQYMRGNRVLGMATGVTFASLSVTSIVLWSTLRTYDTDDDRQGIQVQNNNDLETAQRLLTWTELTRLGAGGIWIASVVQELVVRPSFVVVNEQVHGSVSVSGRW